jgi:GNAT superfamily N-acetyltransferase
VVVLDSNLRSSNTPITNAIGFVGEDQLVTAQVELNKIQSTTDVLLVLLHHHILLPSFSVENALLRCLDSDKVLSFAVKNKAAAVIHGHKHMPYVCQYCDSISGHRMLIVSCGSAHHDATGPFAGTIGGPSCYRLTFRGQLLAKVELIVDQDGAPARELVRVTVEQVEVVVPLFDAYRQFYGQPPDPDGARRFLAERLGRGDSVIFAVVEGGRALGFTQLYPSFSSVSMRPTWVLNDLFVAEDARRRGVGGQLLRAARDHAMKTGAARLALSTAVTNTKAQALYEREGWRRDTVFLHYEYELPKGGG